jgi:hypothetical protein
MLLSVLWYIGWLLILAGALCVIRPMRWLRLPTRRRAIVVALIGAGSSAVTLFIGTATHTVGAPDRLLDRVSPAFQFNERHAIVVSAPAERVYKAMLDVRPDEIAGFRTLAWIRCLGRCEGESILNPPVDTPVLTTALRTSFRKLAETPNEELVFGTLVAAPPEAAARTWTLGAFVNLTDPGYAKAVMNFRLRPEGDSSTRLETETRVFATDPGTVRVFAAYWRTILPGSSLLRVAWLRAIKRRAENP